MAPKTPETKNTSAANSDTSKPRRDHRRGRTLILVAVALLVIGATVMLLLTDDGTDTSEPTTETSVRTDDEDTSSTIEIENEVETTKPAEAIHRRPD